MVREDIIHETENGIVIETIYNDRVPAEHIFTPATDLHVESSRNPSGKYVFWGPVPDYDPECHMVVAGRMFEVANSYTTFDDAEEVNRRDRFNREFVGPQPCGCRDFFDLFKGKDD